MRAHDDPLVCLFAAWNLGDDVVDLNGTASRVLVLEFDGYWSFFDQPLKELAVFHSQLCDGKRVQAGSPIAIGGVQYVIRFAVLENNCFRALILQLLVSPVELGKARSGFSPKIFLRLSRMMWLWIWEA